MSWYPMLYPCLCSNSLYTGNDYVDIRILGSVVNCTRTPAALFPVEPIAGATSFSTTMTLRPLEASCQALEAPTMPAPMTTTSAVCTLIFAPESPLPLKLRVPNAHHSETFQEWHIELEVVES